jgi:hypothetical protein
LAMASGSSPARIKVAQGCAARRPMPWCRPGVGVVPGRDGPKWGRRHARR